MCTEMNGWIASVCSTHLLNALYTFTDFKFRLEKSATYLCQYELATHLHDSTTRDVNRAIGSFRAHPLVSKLRLSLALCNRARAGEPVLFKSHVAYLSICVGPQTMLAARFEVVRGAGEHRAGAISEHGDVYQSSGASNLPRPYIGRTPTTLRSQYDKPPSKTIFCQLSFNSCVYHREPRE